MNQTKQSSMSSKEKVQSLLKRVGLYDRIKGSRLYDLYWYFVDKQLLDARQAEVSFYCNTLQGLRPGDLIFDIGANQGHKTDIFLRLGARVVAVEPDEQNQAVLKRRFLKLRVRRRPLTIVAIAVSAVMGRHTFWVDAPGSAKNTLSKKWVQTLRTDAERFGKSLEFATEKSVETTTLENLISEHGLPYFIKIDVEGHEPSVIAGLSQPVPYLSFEVNLPEFLDEAVQCVRKLGQIAGSGQFNYVTDPSCKAGLVMNEWLSASDFEEVVRTCQDPSIEIFWRTSVRRTAATT